MSSASGAQLPAETLPLTCLHLQIRIQLKSFLKIKFNCLILNGLKNWSLGNEIKKIRNLAAVKIYLESATTENEIPVITPVKAGAICRSAV